MQRVFRALLLVSILCSFSAAIRLPLQACRQSSTHTPCHRAIDGNTNQKWSGNSCSHTNMQNKPWWQANTPRLAHFHTVRIYNRLCGPGCSSHQNNIVIKVDGVPCASYHSSHYFSVKTFHCNRVGQILEIHSTVRSYLMLCEVQAFGKWASMAHTGHRIPLSDCRQSSTHTPCRRAIDNNLNQHWSGKSCAHTQLQKNPWWQANTNRLAHIQQVRIYTRLCTPPCRVNFRNIVVKVDGHVCARHKGVGLGSTITLNCNRVGQVVEIQAMAERTYLMLCEVQVFGTYASLAHKGGKLPLQECRQSSTHTPCRRAIDNNLNQHWPGKSCSHTKMQKGPWWQASTNRLAHIRQVRIYARLCGPVCSRYLKDLIIKVDGHVCARYTSTKGYLSTHTFECNRVGQVVEIRSRAKTYLMLCEVQVFGNYASLAHKGRLLPLQDCRQSSTHTPCRRAIDNNFSQYWSGKSCAHTQLQKNPWWQANTNRLAHIQQVRIYTRLCTPPCRVNFRHIVVKVDGHICARHKGVGLGSTITLNCDSVGQVVEIQAMAKKTYLMLCEVQVFGTYASLAHKGALLPLKHCSQSSTHTPCARAIDGKLAQHFTAKSCSHTKMQTKPWWQAKTIKPAFIQQVRIYARLCGPVCSRYLKNIIVKVDGRVCASYHSTAGYLSTRTFNCNRYGSTVRIESTAKTYLMLCEVQVFGRYGRKPPTHIEPGTGEETGTHETGTTGESGSPSGHGETGEVVSFERHCIDGHDSSEHKLGTSWTTKVPAEGYCYHYSCTEKSEAGPVSVDCMDASGHCVKPSSEGTDFACRSGYTSCSCVHRDGRTGIIFS
ncbi:hypothetical protein BOX15_Mlig000828g6 [Macrostomum lignano]|uniref:Fucolectin tachylectin-4 pentraxin-1 domain-containing protein n=1 Tax=Macrostomum lignano TaxID=282301 RepID=A0A267FPF7_9PLAT|nr:hypothetical protein BOX15_Mlig000828g6 [Macrostomum lignano]